MATQEEIAALDNEVRQYSSFVLRPDETHRRFESLAEIEQFLSTELRFWSPFAEQEQLVPLNQARDMLRRARESGNKAHLVDVFRTIGSRDLVLSESSLGRWFESLENDQQRTGAWRARKGLSIDANSGKISGVVRWTLHQLGLAVSHSRVKGAASRT